MTNGQRIVMVQAVAAQQPVLLSTVMTHCMVNIVTVFQIALHMIRHLIAVQLFMAAVGHPIAWQNIVVQCRAHRAVIAALGKYYLAGLVVRLRHVMLVGIIQPRGRIIVRNAHRLTVRVGMGKRGLTLPISRGAIPPLVHRPVQYGDWPHVMFRRQPRFLTQRAHMNFPLIVITGHRR